MSLRKGIVVEVHPEDHSVDIVMADDGSRLIGVQVMTPNGSTRTGTVDLPAIPKRKNKWDISRATGQDLHAIVGFVGRNPVVTGFIFPQVNQMLSADPTLRITRHQSDVIETLDGKGNYQWIHPSGTYVRFGETPDLEAPANADGDAKADRNTALKPFVRLGLAGGAMELTIAPDGSIKVTTQKGIEVQAAEPSTIKAPKLVLDSDVEITKTLKVAGATSLKNVTSNDKDISDKHRHLNSGGPSTGGPVA